MLQPQFEHGGAYYASCDEIPGLDFAVMVRDDGSLGVSGHLHRRPTLSAVKRGWNSARSQDGRGIVLLRVLQTIQTTKPSSFSLENVKPLATYQN